MAPRPPIPGLRSVRRGGSFLLTALLTLGILVAVNWIGNRRHLRFDVTSEGRYTLSPQTRQILHGLEKEVLFLGFFPAGDPNQVPLTRLLDVYRAQSERVTVRFVDPDQNPGMAARYAVHEPGLYLSVDGRTEKARTTNEEGITNALVRAIRNRKVRVGFLTGHGELDPGDRGRDGLFAATAGLSETAYELSRVGFLARGPLPDSLDILVIASPEQDPLPEELAAIDAWMNRGGRLLVFVDPAPRIGLRDFLEPWGALVGDDVIIDSDAAGRVVGLDKYAPIVTRYENTPITAGFHFATFFPLCRSVGLVKSLPEGGRGWILFKSGNGTWAETGPIDGREKIDPGVDRLGPIPMAVAIRRDDRAGARLVVFGDSDFATNKYWRVPGSGDLVLNAFAWLAERPDEIAVRSVEPADRRVDLTARQARGVFTLGVVLLPLAVIGAGIWVGWRRYGR